MRFSSVNDGKNLVQRYSSSILVGWVNSCPPVSGWFRWKASKVVAHRCLLLFIGCKECRQNAKLPPQFSRCGGDLLLRGCQSLLQFPKFFQLDKTGRCFLIRVGFDFSQWCVAGWTVIILASLQSKDGGVQVFERNLAAPGLKLCGDAYHLFEPEVWCFECAEQTLSR